MTTDGAAEILVVDDDPDLLELIVTVLEQAGFPARCASNGREALDAAEEHQPKLVLLDMLMPVMDGWATARALRERYGHDVKIIVVTAAEHARAWAQEVDADGVVAKPFDLRGLLGAVREHTTEARA